MIVSAFIRLSIIIRLSSFEPLPAARDIQHESERRLILIKGVNTGDVYFDKRI